jgi:endonuclease YncB( thermonuclease family)
MYEYKASVRRVVDADTLDLDIDLGFGIITRQRVRLARINAWETRGPEREQGLIAKAFVEQALVCDLYEFIWIRTDKRGKFGRWIAEIQFIENNGDEKSELANLSDVLVQRGHARYQDY